jgi:hypothetical protein
MGNPKQIFRIIAVSVFILCFGNLSVSAVYVTGRPANDTLCLSAGPITLIGEAPSGKIFDCSTPAAITNTVLGTCIFDPSIAGVGLHTIIYNPAGGGGNTLTFTIRVIASSATLDAFDDVCITDAVFALSGGSPAGGVYSGTGVDGSGNFDPANAGAGSYTITYTSTDGCTASQDLEVVDSLLVSLNPFTPDCEFDSAFTLTG